MLRIESKTNKPKEIIVDGDKMQPLEVGYIVETPSGMNQYVGNLVMRTARDYHLS